MTKKEFEKDLIMNLMVIFYIQIILVLLWCKPFCTIKTPGVSTQLTHKAETDREELNLFPCQMF